MKKQMTHWLIPVVAGYFFLSAPVVQAQLLDSIVAIVEEDVVLESELGRETQMIAERIKASQTPLPPSDILRGQVLERLILQKLQFQLAERSGVQVGDDMIRSYVEEIARNNQMDYEQFRQQLTAQGMNYKAFEDNIRNEIVINQLRAREIGSRVQVSDREIQHYLDTQAYASDSNASYHLGHILVSLSETATATAIQKAKAKAEKIVTQLRQGADFKQLAVQMSDGVKALQGGDLGWGNLRQIPTLFVDDVKKMQEGDIAEPIRSPSGFHIIKLLGLKGGLKLDESHIVTKTQARHILIKTNELVNDEEAKNRLNGLKGRIEDGDDFATLARSHSDDTASALKGGSLDWVVPGVLVPKFEQAMNNLGLDEISEPIQTQFGWHIIQVLGREEQDNTSEHKKNQIKEEIRRRKIEEETELWLRRLRGEAFVQIYQGRL